LKVRQAQKMRAEHAARVRPAAVSRILAVSVVVLAPAIFAATADASPSIGDLKQLTVEDLMNVEVTSVTRHPEKLIAAASAVQVITQDDIRRSGATSIPEALRLADNLQVAQKNSHDWGITARGFNTDLANKLLVMVDGRTVYTPLYSGVFWDVQDYLLEDIDRIEVISGPGGALWGANAVNGVINIITKSAKDTPGIYADAGGGTQPREFGDARYGAPLGANADFRVYGKFSDRRNEVAANGASQTDSWRQGRGGFRIDAEASSQDHLTVQGDLYMGHDDEQAGGTNNVSGENVLGRWSRSLPGGSDFTLQSFIDRTHINDPVNPLIVAGMQFAPAGRVQDDLTTFDVDFQNRLRAGSINQVAWGLGLRHTHDVVANAPALGFFPAVLNQTLYSAFVQDELKLRQDLLFTLGTKLEHNDYTGFEYGPDARLHWTLNADQSLWGAVSRAVRTPSRIDHDLSEGIPPYLVVLKGGSDFTSEILIAYELGYRAQLNSKMTTSVSAFFNQYHDVRSLSYTPVTLLPFYFANNVEGNTDGLEFSGNYQVSQAWSLHAGYTLLEEHLRVKPGETDLNNAHNEIADPQHQASLRSSLNLPRHVEWDMALRWIDAVHLYSGALTGTVPSYFELNTRLAWHASARLEFSVAGENLLHNHHPEYGFPDPSRAEIERSAYGKVAWRY
jgi:iron complex outermembrane receptor protein